jgi:hypothetical protein
MIKEAAAWLAIAAGLAAYMWIDGASPKGIALVLAIWTVLCAGGYAANRLIARRGRTAHVHGAAYADGELRTIEETSGRRRMVVRRNGAIASREAVAADAKLDARAHELHFEREVRFADNRAVLWLETDGDRGDLHGLQPQPDTAPRWCNPRLVTTRAVLAGEPIVLVLHELPGEGEDDADGLDLLALDGTPRWSARLPGKTVGEARWLFVTHDALVLVGRREALQLAMGSGAIAWRATL